MSLLLKADGLVQTLSGVIVLLGLQLNERCAGLLAVGHRRADQLLADTFLAVILVYEQVVQDPVLSEPCRRVFGIQLGKTDRCIFLIQRHKNDRLVMVQTF